ncbi:MAG: protein kinase [Armatimonadetes bacterium]|nr:protein kinase [Armatimonadota bacterium]
MAQLLVAGVLLEDRYKIKRVLASTGVGAIYLVEDVKITAKNWAIKEFLIPPLPLAQQTEIRDKFRAEAERLKTVSHSNIARVIDYFSEGMREYLVMEFVDGASVQAILQMSVTFLPEKQVLRWVGQICDALEYLHSLNNPIVFRDLRPINIMLDKDENIKLVNFGLDRIFDAVQMKTVATGFCSPDAFDETADSRADLFGIGATLYFMLTKEKPALVPAPMKSYNSQVSPDVEKIVLRALDKSSEPRYLSAAEIRSDIEKVLFPPSAVPSAAPKPSPLTDFFEGARTLTRRFPLILAAMARSFRRPSIIFTVLAAVIVLFVGLNKISPRAPSYVKMGPVLYAACGGSEVWTIDPNTRKSIHKWSPGTTPARFAATKQGTVYVSNYEGHELAVVDPQNDVVMSHIRVERNPEALAVSPDQRWILVASRATNNISIIATGPEVRVVGITAVGNTPRDILITSDSKFAYVANAASNTVSIIDVTAKVVKKTILVGRGPQSLASNADGTRIYVANENSDDLTVIDTGTQEVIGSVFLDGKGPYHILSFSATYTLYVSDTGGHQVLAVDTASDTLKSHIPVISPRDMALSPRGDSIFVSCDDSKIAMIDPYGNFVRYTFTVGKDPTALLTVK